jgi:hypothetical protein
MKTEKQRTEVNERRSKQRRARIIEIKMFDRKATDNATVECLWQKLIFAALFFRRSDPDKRSKPEM